MEAKLSVAIIASEAHPYSRTGGLGDVAGALARTLASLGHAVTLVLPLYRETANRFPDLKAENLRLKIPVGDRFSEGEIFSARPQKNLAAHFVKNARYFDRDGLYNDRDGDFSDNAERFVFFSRAAVKLLEKLGTPVDIVHCHDWQAGLVPAYLKLEEKENPFFAKTKSLFTIHNLSFGGFFWHLDMPLTGLPWSVFTPDGLEFYGKISFLKSGIVYADAVSTVSKKYAAEILTPEFSHGFDGILRTRGERLFGIMNGVDYGEWNPQTDKWLPKNYGPDDVEGKKACKRELIREMGLPVGPEAPVFGLVSRLTEQKGIDLLLGAADEIGRRGGGVAVLGVGDPHYHFWLEETQKRAAFFKLKIGFDTGLSHRIEAGADFFLMPSKFEPCGLNQLYSLKYGTPPIVRATGGLDDSIENFNPSTLKGNGFKFQQFDVASLVGKIDEGLAAYRDQKSWRALLKNAMLCDYSWEHAAKEYVERYREISNVRTTQGSRGRAVGDHRHRTRKTSQRL